jgi:hypothetical protein
MPKRIQLIKTPFPQDKLRVLEGENQDNPNLPSQVDKLKNIILKRKRATARVDFNKEGMVKHWTKASHGKGRSWINHP